MDFSKYLSTAFDYLSWFLNSVDDKVSNVILGGWVAIAGFTGAIVALFLITSLLSPRRSDD
jgi:Fe2+ transport system protein B